MTQNRQYRLAARPHGRPTDQDWKLTTEDVPAAPPEGGILVQVWYVSMDPAMRGWMNAGRSYVPPVEIGEVMRAGAVGRVVASRNPRFPEGTFVSGYFGVQEYAVSDGRGVVAVDPARAPLPAYLGLLGMTGLTAYFGLLDVAEHHDGDVVLVSGAAGAVGAAVCQIAKLKGSKVIGIAGGAAKTAYLREELGVDATVDYRAGDVPAALREAAPDGVDVFFDNVGGDILDAGLARLRRGARVAICGAISQYNATGKPQGPANYMSLLVNRATMRGFVVTDFAAKYPEAVSALTDWYAAGKLRERHDVAHGLENFPDTLLRLFDGANQGKLVLRLAAADEAG